MRSVGQRGARPSRPRQRNGRGASRHPGRMPGTRPLVLPVRGRTGPLHRPRDVACPRGPRPARRRAVHYGTQRGGDIVCRRSRGSRHHARGGAAAARKQDIRRLRTRIRLRFRPPERLDCPYGRTRLLGGPSRHRARRGDAGAHRDDRRRRARACLPALLPVLHRMPRDRPARLRGKRDERIGDLVLCRCRRDAGALAGRSAALRRDGHGGLGPGGRRRPAIGVLHEARLLLRQAGQGLDAVTPRAATA